MKNQSVHPRRAAIVLVTVMSFVMSLTPAAPAKPVAARERPTRMAATPSPDSVKLGAREAYGKLPLSFEPNRGQADPQVKYLSRGQGYTLLLNATEAVLALRSADYEASAEGRGAEPSRSSSAASGNARSAMLRMKFVGAR